MAELLKLLREARPEITGGLVVAAVTAVVGALYASVGIWAVVLVAMGAVWLGCTYLAFKRTPPLVEGGKGTWQYPRWRAWALAGMIIIPLLGLGVVGYHRYQGEWESAQVEVSTVKVIPSLTLVAETTTPLMSALDQNAVYHYQNIEPMPSLIEAYTRRGNAYAQRGDYDRAIVDYDQAIELAQLVLDKRAEVYFNRGLAYAQNGETNKAIADLRWVLEVSSDPELRKQAEERLKALGQGN